MEIDTAGAKQSGRSWTDVSVLLKVPRDAEPGYHVVKLIPTPEVFEKAPGAAGANVVSVTSVPVFFNVVGEAKRDGVILDTKLAEITDGGFKLETPFKNTGTVTLYSRAINEVYRGSELIGEYASSREYVEPGKVQNFNTPVTGFFTEGEYEIKSKVIFTTDEAEQDSRIMLQAETGEQREAEEESPLPLIMGVILIVVIAIIIYRRVQ